MCSVFGFYGDQHSGQLFTDSLSAMEYRGYDSAGIYFSDIILKGTGSVAQVSSFQNWSTLSGNFGLGHTRWATNGEVSTLNAHPHTDQNNKVVVVHNGIVENTEELKSKYGLQHTSETDTGVLVEYLAASNSSPLETLQRCLNEVRGHYSFICYFKEYDVLLALSNGKPLIVGISPPTIYVSSDVLGFINLTDECIYLPAQTIYDLKTRQIFDSFLRPLILSPQKLSKELASPYKIEFSDITLKEIKEQEYVISRPKNNLDKLKLKHAYIVGSGSSYNAALFAAHYFGWTPIVASEYKFRPHIPEGSDVILVSQSGESEDVLSVIRDTPNCRHLGLLNITNSSVGRLCDEVIEINCGPEIGVAATKSFTSQIACFLELMDVKNLSTHFSYTDINKYNPRLGDLAATLARQEHIYILGRGPHYSIAREIALKFKEMCYIHAEAIEGGEMKHGPLALLDRDSWVIVLNPTDCTHKDTLMTAAQLKTRSINIIGISNKMNAMYSSYIRIKSGKPESYGVAQVFPAQLLAHKIAMLRNINPDRPRNLAKSVTVG